MEPTNSLAQQWKTYFDDPPVSELMRDSAGWLRIHSLPGSKRYPESEDEYAEMLRRQNETADLVLGASSQCVLIMNRVADEHNSVDWCEESQTLGLPLTPTDAWGRIPYDEDPPVFLEFAIAEIIWRPHAWDFIIRAVADERQYGLLVFSKLKGQAYAPYDGGADLFVATIHQRNQLRGLWSDWLSPRKDGL